MQHVPKTGPRQGARVSTQEQLVVKKKLKCAGPLTRFSSAHGRDEKGENFQATATAHPIFGPIKSLVVFLRCPALLFWISGSKPGVKGAQRLCAPLSASTGRGNDRLALPAVQTLTKARGRYQNITAFVYHNDTLGADP
jgi:hypothetical protein